MNIKHIASCTLFGFLLVSSAMASTITLNGNNSQPGFLSMTVDGVSVIALDYTGQRYATQGQTFLANLYSFSDLASAYYGPNDPYIKYADYITRYEEDIFLFGLLKSIPNPTLAQRTGIQDAVYYLSGASGFNNASALAYATQAQNEIAANGTANLGDLSRFRFINSAFTSNGSTVPANLLVQGFLYETAGTTHAPEPASLLLIGSGLVIVSLFRRRNKAS